MKFLKYKVGDTKFDETEKFDESFETDVSGRALKPEILGELESSLLPKSIELKKRKVINNIIDFAGELQDFALKYHLDNILRYSKILTNAANSFDIKKIDKALDNFTVLVNAVKKKNNT